MLCCAVLCGQQRVSVFLYRVLWSWYTEKLNDTKKLSSHTLRQVVCSGLCVRTWLHHTRWSFCHHYNINITTITGYQQSLLPFLLRRPLLTQVTILIRNMMGYILRIQNEKTNSSHFVAVECVRNWYFRNVNTWVSVDVYMHWYVYKYMWFLCTFYVNGLVENQMHMLQCLCSCFWSNGDHLDWLAFSLNANNLFMNFFLHTWVVFSGLPVTVEGWTLRPCCQTASSEVGID